MGIEIICVVILMGIEIFICVVILMDIQTFICTAYNIVGLVCRILSLLHGSFAKETYNFIDPTNQSHPISSSLCLFCHVPLKRNQLD